MTADLADQALERLRGAAKHGGSFFTSDLSVDEFLLTEQAGFTPLHIVVGSSIYHVGYQFVGFNQNQELPVLTHATREARALAMSRMLAEAKEVGADGIIGVRLEIGRGEWGGHLLEFVAIGTAIKHTGAGGYRNQLGEPFTSHLSGQEFYALLHAGYRPLGMVMGNCVYHVASQGLGQWFSNVGKNVEMPNFTSAFYEARELAMDRMQREAQAHAAEGVVGVDIHERSHGWGGHTIEFFALGTAVVPVRQDHVIPTPEIGLSLDR
jgi:uncharacterized protein YbjQ (UPF0145 family)